MKNIKTKKVIRMGLYLSVLFALVMMLILGIAVKQKTNLGGMAAGCVTTHRSFVFVGQTCCSGLVKTACKGSGSFAYCRCIRKCPGNMAWAYDWRGCGCSSDGDCSTNKLRGKCDDGKCAINRQTPTLVDTCVKQKDGEWCESANQCCSGRCHGITNSEGKLSYFCY